MRVPLETVIEFVKQHHPYASKWDYADLCAWIAAFAKQDLLICATTDGTRIDGLIMFRLLMRAIDGRSNTLNFDPEGCVVFIDFFYAPTDEMRRGLVIAAIHRIGRRDWVAWERRNVLRIYRAEQVVNHILKGQKV